VGRVALRLGLPAQRARGGVAWVLGAQKTVPCATLGDGNGRGAAIAIRAVRSAFFVY